MVSVLAWPDDSTPFPCLLQGPKLMTRLCRAIKLRCMAARGGLSQADPGCLSPSPGALGSNKWKLSPSLIIQCITLYTPHPTKKPCSAARPRGSSFLSLFLMSALEEEPYLQKLPLRKSPFITEMWHGRQPLPSCQIHVLKPLGQKD